MGNKKKEKKSIENTSFKTTNNEKSEIECISPDIKENLGVIHKGLFKQTMDVENFIKKKDFSNFFSAQKNASNLFRQHTDTIRKASIKHSEMMKAFTYKTPDFFPSCVNTSKKESSENIIEDLSKKQKKLILFELINLSEKEKVDKYFKSSSGEKIVYLNENRYKESLQQSTKSLPLNINLPNYVEKITVHSLYCFGDYFSLIFECDLKLKEYNEEVVGNQSEVLNKRYKIYEELQKEIEKLIPKEFYGVFFNKELKFSNYNFSLPSIYIYNLSNYKHIFEESEDRIEDRFCSSTLNGKAHSFLNRFNEYEDNDYNKLKFNKLSHIGIKAEELFAVIGDKLILSVSKKYFQDFLKAIPRNFTILCFEEKKLFSFIMELISKYYLFILLEKYLIDLEKIEILKISEIHEENIAAKKKELSAIKANFDEINEKLLSYFAIFDCFKKSDFRFQDEETWNYSLSNRWDEYSISNYFKEYLEANIKKIEKRKKYLEKVISDGVNTINTEIGLNKNKPIINPLFKEVEQEIVQQIKKWDGKISQERIECWLSNFKNKKERLIALKLLDKLEYIEYKNLKSFIKSAYHHLLRDINKDNLKDCDISSIGSLTSGSTHSLKPFQEENKISKNLFKSIEKLEKLDECELKKTLILIDDFIGSGNTFIKWYGKNKTLLKKYGVVIYVCYVGLKKGIIHITEKTKTEVICAHVLEEDHQVMNGTLFEDEGKKDIEELVEKYSSITETNFVWGYDDCQLLFSFDDNIPNNSLAILWSNNKWMPLFERK